MVMQYESTLERMYRDDGYTTHYNQIDNQCATEMPCTKCSGSCRYIGLKKQLMNHTSYIAISQCVKCGHEFEF